MDPFDQELDAFAKSDWGKATLTPTDASGLCLRATLALLARLQATGLADGVELWNLTMAVEGVGRGDPGYNTHWVLVRNGEVIDVSARQFEADGPHIRRCLADDEFKRWELHRRVDPDSPEMWCGGMVPNREIPPYWRDLVDVGPPGDLPDWSYPRALLEATSRWYLPPDDLFARERVLWDRGYRLIAGVDEAGRAAWAGPLVAAAVILPPISTLEG